MAYWGGKNRWKQEVFKKRWKCLPPTWLMSFSKSSTLFSRPLGTMMLKLTRVPHPIPQPSSTGIPGPPSRLRALRKTFPAGEKRSTYCLQCPHPATPIPRYALQNLALSWTGNQNWQRSVKNTSSKLPPPHLGSVFNKFPKGGSTPFKARDALRARAKKSLLP